MNSKKRLDRNGLTEEEFLASYNPHHYEKPAVTVDMLIFTVNPENDYELELLMIERGGHPFLGCWALPGGFVEMDESLDEAAARELEEETGLKDIYMEQMYSFGDVGRDPRMRVISVAYIALVAKERLRPVAGDDAAKVRWFSVHQENDGEIWLCAKDPKDEKDKKLSEKDIAFDHEKEIRIALERLRNKVQYTEIAFELVGEKFTLTQLQMIYEAILGKELHKPNFRRSIAPHVVKTDEKVVVGNARPSFLYQKKI